jgi:hypothetical protein
MAKKRAVKKSKKTPKKLRKKQTVARPDSMGGPDWSFPAGGIFRPGKAG